MPTQPYVWRLCSLPWLMAHVAAKQCRRVHRYVHPNSGTLRLRGKGGAIVEWLQYFCIYCFFPGAAVMA